MANSLLVETIASVIASAAPLVFAGVGETITEKVGITNLSLDGSILLSAMAGFAAAMLSGSLLVGVITAMLVGALVAGIVATGSIALRQDQVAVGFVLTVLCTALSSFLGKPYVRVPGPSMPHLPIPYLADIPVIGPIFFNHDLLVYLSYVVIFGTVFLFNRTQLGLRLRAVGERPEAAFARGINVNRYRYLFTCLGGALVGLGGATFSLSVKLGWSYQHTAGFGWIALAIVIFGGWNPLRVALGAYLFGALNSLASILQPAFPTVPTQVFQTAPFAFMILTLLIMNGDVLERLPRGSRWLRKLLQGQAPAGLGKRFQSD
ncbi:MAG: ABC transporter permease [Chloroflexi bacterium]|mgnify:CR=1 FL=1|nr:ABC transporter permease [Chloroflexota bacterium]